MDAAREAALVAALLEIPGRAAEVLECETAVAIARVAERMAEARDVLYLGRGACFPIALEGALKLKEISYIHAEGYAAGEMKHGPIALIDRHVPVVAIAPSGPLFEKTASNVQEAAVVGKKDPGRGEAVVAFVIPKEGQTVQPDELRAFARDQGLAQWKVPKEVFVVEDLPRSPRSCELKWRGTEANPLWN